MATKKNVTTPSNDTIDLGLQKRGLDTVKKLFLAGVSPTGDNLTAYNACARGQPTAADVERLESYLADHFI